jgi:hypothetical protein
MNPMCDESYRSSDLRLCAFLLTRGSRLVTVDRNSQSDRAAFVLSPRPDPSDVLAFSEGRAVAEVNALCSALKLLKAKLYGR